MKDTEEGDGGGDIDSSPMENQHSTWGTIALSHVMWSKMHLPPYDIYHQANNWGSREGNVIIVLHLPYRISLYYLPGLHACVRLWPLWSVMLSPYSVCFMFKLMLGKAPPYLSSLVTMATPTCSTRCISLIIPKANTSFVRLSLQFSAACDSNELQNSLKLETFISLTNFKHLLSEQLTDRCSCT